MKQSICASGEDNFVYRNSEGAVIEFNCSSNTTSSLLDNSTFIYRHSTLAKYLIYNVNTKMLAYIDGEGVQFQYVGWGPKGHSLIFVQRNNLFYKKDIQARAVKLTHDGVPGEIFNGIPDWVYEEEVLSSDNAVWWSPDGNSIVYAMFNDTSVRKFEYILYGEAQDQYVQSRRIAYPKVQYISAIQKDSISKVGHAVYMLLCDVEKSFITVGHAVCMLLCDVEKSFITVGHAVYMLLCDVDKSFITVGHAVYMLLCDVEKSFITVGHAVYMLLCDVEKSFITVGHAVYMLLCDVEKSFITVGHAVYMLLCDVDKSFITVGHAVYMLLCKAEPYVVWRDNNYVLVTWLNREQNYSILSLCGMENGTCIKNHQVVAEGGWVELHTSPIFTTDGRHYFLVLPQRYGLSGHFKHIAKIESSQLQAEGRRQFLTNGMWDVMEIVSYDDKLQMIYFIVTKSDDPRKRHLYSTSTNSSAVNFKLECLTCTYAEGCQYVSASFSTLGNFYVLGCEGPDVPSYILRSTDGRDLVVLEDNHLLRQKLANKAMPKADYFHIPISENETIWGKLLLPPVVKKDDSAYPILMSVYGGPSTQTVTERFSLGWEHYLCVTHNIIIGFADGRGTSGRGDKWLHANYKRFGTVEVDDTNAAGRFFSDLHYVESSKKAIWGWSYGGFLTASVLGSGKDIFECGIAVAPVTDWRYYGRSEVRLEILRGQTGDIMVGQTGDIMVGQTGDIMEGQTGDIMVGQTGDIMVGQTGDIMVGQTGDIMVGQTGDIMVGQTGDIMVGQTGDIMVRGQTGDIMVGQTGDIMEGQTGDIMEGQTGDIMVGQTGDIMVGQTGDIMVGQTGDIMVGQRGQTGDIMVGQTGDIMVGQTGDIMVGQTGDIMVGQTGDIMVGQTGDIMVGQTGDIMVGQRGQTGDITAGQMSDWRYNGRSDVRGQTGDIMVGQTGDILEGQTGDMVGQRSNWRHYGRSEVRLETLRGQTGDIMVGQTGDIMEGQTGDIMVGQTGDIMVGQRSDWRYYGRSDWRYYGQTGDIMVGQTGDILEGQTGDMVRGQTGDIMVGQTGDIMVGQRSDWRYYGRSEVRLEILRQVRCQTGDIMVGQRSDWRYYGRSEVRLEILRGQTGDIMVGQRSDWRYYSRSEVISGDIMVGQTGDIMVRGQTGDITEGQTGDIVVGPEGQTGDIMEGQTGDIMVGQTVIYGRSEV
ncbi:hypothetical protein CHS0354_040656 [Potamilus streckersoni]|uniref:Uncharacterized protein n=1 Tax=Potamilus streckersoni TaxID=2493646 RepID=A0AAE0TCK8_9BIVA|nr:hypothetical protein CHS0354_040656 [Potamilus streckersoni]